ncbi:hypothetical protein EN837_08250 [bacterium M00.F.Ca.ET.194.01.1.1]|nr:hypothetical protein EN837_08250 [bacterium M00.F.Ca.ET.194.01.1.1]TGS56252.1 hypothetical protein EN822_08250 [bacterium M00.F.Ca.ET.179.01.1.1]TGV49157.1 hypothetical protein EN811_08250 [bacterium M00.F.Ca.ET.168.01.1.1]
MGREVRRVPADWQHPRYTEENAPHGRAVGRYIPMFDGGYAEAAADFLEKANAEGLQEAIDYYGEAPKQENYMPDWPQEQRTHLMMYEDTTEGTPISPAFATPEELARWLTDTGASSFGDQTASYEAWLRVAKGGFAPSAVLYDGSLTSGVEAIA